MMEITYDVAIKRKIKAATNTVVTFTEKLLQLNVRLRFFTRGLRYIIHFSPPFAA
jgi:hypothetical protein